MAITEFFPYWQSFLDSVVKVVAIVGVPYIAWRMQQATADAKKAEAKTDAQYHVIHDFLNHEKRVLLSDKATLARERYEHSKRDDHKQFMEVAEKALRDHDAGQKKVDDKAKAIASGENPQTTITLPKVDAPVIVVPATDKDAPAVVMPESIPTTGMRVVEAPVTVVSPDTPPTKE